MSDPSSSKEEPVQPPAGEHLLGVPMADLAGLSVDEIHRNKVAVTMVMHYYKQLLGENVSLKNDLNTVRTYVDGYRAKKTDSSVGAGLQFLSTLLVGFGINLLTSAVTAPGCVTLFGGMITGGFGLYYSLRNSR